MNPNISFEELEQKLQKANKDLNKFDELVSRIFEQKDMADLENGLS